jgi:hypothetical protein
MVAIREMEMPKSCWRCNFCYDNKGYYYCAINNNLLAFSIVDIPSERPKNCPLVEIVTCEDCKSNNDNTCTIDGCGIVDDYFCASAERRE